MKDTPMTADAYIKGSNQLEYVCESSLHTKGNMSGISTLAKFKAAQDLRIQTRDLPEKSKPSRHLQRSGSSSSSGTLSAPNTNASSPTTTSPSATSQSTSFNERELDGDEDGECSPETPLPPSSTGKKRRRRTANQIDRKFACSYPGCVKAYGSEGSLTQHQRLKHRVDLANPPNQTGNFFLPLHRARNAAAAATNHTIYRQPPGSTRTVNIRPALDGMIIAPFEASVAAAVAASTNTVSVPVSVPSPVSTVATASSLPIDKVSTEFMLNSASAHSQARQSLRARSNSMPVSSSGLGKIAQSPYSNRSKGPTTTPRPQSTRRSRMNSTPRARTSTAAMASSKPTKRRSKSESLEEISLGGLMGTPQQQLFDDRKSFPSRVFSDTTSPHSSFSVDIHTRTILASPPPPFDWSSIDMRDHSPDSSSDEVIDSDILSVLADYGDDTVSNNEDTLGIVNSTNPFSAMDVDDGMLPTEPLESCMGRHSSVGLTPPVSATMAQRVDPSLSPHGGPGPVVAVEGRTTEFLGVTDDWQYLSTHLEKMTMLQEPDHMIASGTFATNEMDPFQLDIVSEDEEDETIHTARTTRGMYLPIYPQSLSRTLSSALLDDSSRSPLWTKEVPTNDMEAASLYMDEVDLPTFAALRAESKAVSRPLSPMYSFAKGSHPMYDRQISLGSVGSVGSLGGMNSFAADSSLFNTLDSMDCMEDVRI